MNKKYLLALALVAVMVISVLPLIAAESNADTQSVENKSVDVTWMRSGDAQKYVVEDSLWGGNLATIYQQSDMEMTATWSALNSISATIYGKNSAGDDLVWDGSNSTGGFHYTTDHLGDTYTTYPTATIKGEGTVRFTGTFDLGPLLKAGTDITNLKVGIDPYTTTSKQVALNDQMFVFIYPTGTQLNEDNFMNYYVFGAGYESLSAWLGNPDSVETFNGVPMVHTFRDPAYYAGGNQEGQDYATYGAKLTALGYTDWNDKNGWFGHGLTYLYDSDIASGNFSSVDQLYLSDGLFFMNNDPSTVLRDFSIYNGNIPSNWTIDVFAVNTDAVGGIAQPQVFVNYNEETFGSTGSLEIGKAYGDSYSVSGSITSGDPKDLYLDSKGKTDHSKNAHDLGTAVKENGNNWFEYNVFNGNGGHAAFVQGDKLTQVGGYTLTANGDGTFTITMDGDTYAVGAKVSISNNFIQGANNANAITKDKTLSSKYVWSDGTITAIWTSAPGQQQFSGKQLAGDGHSFTVYAPWVDISQPYYVYIHLDGITGLVNTGSFGPDKTFSVFVQGPSFPDGTYVDVLMNGTYSFKDLIPGTYLIRENEPGFSPAFYVNGVLVQTGGTYAIQVYADQTAKVLLKNKPGNDVPTSEIVIKKTVQTLDGFDSGVGFKFNIYADPNKTSYVGYLVTGNDGVGTYTINNCDVGTTFYLFEDMNAAQSALYEPQTGYIEVVSTPVSYDPRAEVNVTNYLMTAGFTIEKWVEDTNNDFVSGGAGFTFEVYSALNGDGSVDLTSFVESKTTDYTGTVTFSGPQYVIGETYYVIEKMTTVQHDKYNDASGPLAVIAETISNIETYDYCNVLAYGSITVDMEVEVLETHEFIADYVTGGYDPNASEIPGSDWMRPIQFDLADVLAGNPFTGDLVTGATLVYAGTYTITAQPNGDLLVELNFLPGLAANTYTTVIMGNANSGLDVLSVIGSSDVSQFNGGIGVYRADAGYSITIPADDIASFATGGLDSQYLFLQSGIDTQTIKLNVIDQYPDLAYSLTLTSNDTGQVVDTYSLGNLQSHTTGHLLPGSYTLSENNMALYKNITVTANHDTTLSLKNTENLTVHDNP